MDALPPDLDPDELPFELPAEDQPTTDDLPAVEGTLLQELIRRAQSVYEEALTRQQEGDWSGYGEKIRELEQILNDLTRLTN